MVIKIVFFALLCYYLFKTIQEKGQNIQDIYRLILSQFSAANGLLLLLIFSLTFLNWACESKKWQTLARRVEIISFWQAFGGVFAGLALGFVMPNQVGDAAGRILSLKSRQRFNNIGAALLSNGLQFYVSLVFGTLGLGYFMVNQVSFQSWYYQILLVLLIITLIIGALVFGYRLSLTKYLERFGLFRKIEPYLIVIDQYEFSEIKEAMFWAMLRYAVFSIQFWLLFQLFNIKLGIIDSFAGIFLVFFSKTLIPAINFLGDLGIREASSLFVFGVYDIEPSLLIATTLSLWCINIFIPTVAGIFWALKLR